MGQCLLRFRLWGYSAKPLLPNFWFLFVDPFNIFGPENYISFGPENNIYFGPENNISFGPAPPSSLYYLPPGTLRVGVWCAGENNLQKLISGHFSEHILDQKLDILSISWSSGTFLTGGFVEGGTVMRWGRRVGCFGRTVSPEEGAEPRTVQTSRFVAHISEHFWRWPTFWRREQNLTPIVRKRADDGHAAPGSLSLLLQSDRGGWLRQKRR